MTVSSWCQEPISEDDDSKDEEQCDSEVGNEHDGLPGTENTVGVWYWIYRIITSLVHD